MISPHCASGKLLLSSLEFEDEFFAWLRAKVTGAKVG